MNLAGCQYKVSDNKQLLQHLSPIALKHAIDRQIEPVDGIAQNCFFVVTNLEKLIYKTVQ